MTPTEVYIHTTLSVLELGLGLELRLRVGLGGGGISVLLWLLSLLLLVLGFEVPAIIEHSEFTTYILWLHIYCMSGSHQQ